MARPRFFLDANVLFSAAWQPASGLNRLWRMRRSVTLLTCPFAIEEASRNLDDSAARERLIGLTGRLTVVADVAGEVPAEAQSLAAKDRPILLAALASHATHLVTGDHRHFGRWFGRELAGILVVTPRQALDSVTPVSKKPRSP